MQNNFDISLSHSEILGMLRDDWTKEKNAILESIGIFLSDAILHSDMQLVVDKYLKLCDQYNY